MYQMLELIAIATGGLFGLLSSVVIFKIYNWEVNRRPINVSID